MSPPRLLAFLVAPLRACFAQKSKEVVFLQSPCAKPSAIKIEQAEQTRPRMAKIAFILAVPQGPRRDHPAGRNA
jgi:hypothetical protein